MDPYEKRKLDKAVQYRTFQIDGAVRADSEGDDGPAVYELAFSSETPVVRWGMSEVLDHEPGSVRLDRLNGGAPVLVNHDTDDQAGVVESARIDDDKMGRAVVRFSRGDRGSEIEQDVQDGIRRLVSVGYRVHKYECTEVDGGPDEVRVTDWEPFEISIASIPADISVGIGRSEFMKTVTNIQEVPTMDRDEENSANGAENNGGQRADEGAIRANIQTENRTRIRQINELADAHDLPELGRQAIEEDWSVERFSQEALTKVGERNNAARAESEHDGEVDLSNKERKRFSMLRLMDAISNPNDRAAQQRAGFELAVSAEAQRGFGSDFNCRGEFVPSSLLEGTGRRDLNAGTATDGAELVATNLLAASFIEVLRNSSAVMQAGITMLPGLVGNVEIPRQTSAAAATWISAEDGDATEGEPQFDQVTLAPKDLACYTEVTRRLLLQSTPAVEGLVRRDLATAIGLGIDLGVLYGSAASGQPRGIVNQSGINTLDLAAAAPTYAELVSLVAMVMADNAMPMSPDSTRWIIEANGWEALSTTPKQGSGVEGNFILGENERIVGRSYSLSNQVTAEEYFFGDWSQVLLGEWGGLEINVDPYTHSLKGKIRYITFKTADVAVRHPQAFAYAHDGITP